MRVLDMFSGIGGFSLGLERAGMTTVAFCEVDPFCRRVLAKHWPEVPIHDDVRTIPRIGGIDLVCGGFPCQPFSHAGKQLGAADDRHLWPAMLAVIERERPAWVLGENVVGIVNMELDAILADLDDIGYACRCFDIPAAAVDAPHIRRRIWIVARDSSRDGKSVGTVDDEGEGLRGVLHDANIGHQQSQQAIRTGWDATVDAGDLLADGKGFGLQARASQSRRRQEAQEPERCGSRIGALLADADRAGREQQCRAESIQAEFGAAECGSRWEPEPGIRRVAPGVSNRVDRLRALGNAVVPQVVEVIGRAIMAAAA